MTYGGMYAQRGNVDNLLKVFNNASEWEVQQGITWYVEANTFGKNLARTYDITLDTAVRVIACLSPNNKWRRNKMDAELVISTWRKDPEFNPRALSCGTFKNNIEKASMILNGRPDYLMGDKVFSFYENIMYPEAFEEVVTVDIWAYRAWVYDSKAQVPTLGNNLYKHIEQDYLVLADLVELPPQQAQAVVWLVVRKAGAGKTCQLQQMRLL